MVWSGKAVLIKADVTYCCAQTGFDSDSYFEALFDYQAHDNTHVLLDLLFSH